jgi:hypothetical protein
MHPRTWSNHVRIDCFAIFVDVANPPTEHIRHRLGIGRGLHNERRGGRNGCLARRECGHRPDYNRSGGHLRGRGLRRGRLSGFRSRCLRERQRRNHRANKNNSCSSHGFPFIELTFHGCFATRVPFGCLDRPRHNAENYSSSRARNLLPAGPEWKPIKLLAMHTKAAGSTRNLRLRFIDVVDLSLPLGRAQPHGYRPCRCSRHAPFGRHAAAL